MKFSYNEVWNDAVAMARSNAAILAALAGVFMLLPSLALLHFFPPPEGNAGGDPSAALETIMEYYKAVLPWLLLAGLVRTVGAISILLVLLGPRTTVGGAIATALMILPFYFLAAFLSGMMVLVGFLLIIPGLYLWGRLALVGPVVVVEGQRNPLTAIARSLDLTKGNGWAVLGLILLIAFAGYVLIAVIGWVFGAIFILAAGKELGTFLGLVVQAIGGAVLSTILIALTASLYRALQGKPALAG